jgi:penicillin-binding protein 2
MRDYQLGDNVSLAIGQGDLLTTPLQMAVAYSTLVTGGRVPRPHLGLEIEDDQGRLLQRIKRAPTRHVSFDQANQQVIMDGLRAAVQEPGGTSTPVFGGWDTGKQQIYGKTGTAERPPHGDMSWYIAYVADKEHPLVLVTAVEDGGFGAATAAPIACRILNEYYGQQAACTPGESRTR